MIRIKNIQYSHFCLSKSERCFCVFSVPFHLHFSTPYHKLLIVAFYKSMFIRFFSFFVTKGGIACVCCIFSEDYQIRIQLQFLHQCSCICLQGYGYRIAFLTFLLHMCEFHIFSYLFLKQKRHFSIKLLKMQNNPLVIYLTV